MVELEIKEITVFKKSDKTLITKIFEDEDGIKQITSNDVEVDIKLKDLLENESSKEIKERRLL